MAKEILVSRGPNLVLQLVLGLRVRGGVGGCNNIFCFLRNIPVHNKIRQPEITSNANTRFSILVLPQTEKVEKYAVSKEKSST